MLQLTAVMSLLTSAIRCQFVHRRRCRHTHAAKVRLVYTQYDASACVGINVCSHVTRLDKDFGLLPNLPPVPAVSPSDFTVGRRTFRVAGRSWCI